MMSLLFFLFVVGLVLYVINALPMAGWIVVMMNAVIVFIVVVRLLDAFGIYHVRLPS